MKPKTNKKTAKKTVRKSSVRSSAKPTTKGSRSLLSSTPSFSRRQLGILASVFVVFGIFFIFLSRANSSLAIVEAETMTVPAGAIILNDSSASGTKALKFTANGTSSGSFSLPSESINMTLRAKGVSCSGSPQAVVKVDNAQIQTATVNSTGWADYTVPAKLLAGSHTITITFPNDYNQYAGNSGNLKCSRDLLVDKVEFFGPAVANGTIALTGLSEGATITGPVSVEAKSSGFTLAKAEFFIDNVLYRTENASPFCMAADPSGPPCYNWNDPAQNTQASNGPHIIKVIGYDSTGAKQAEKVVNITVYNSTSTPPPPPPSGTNPSGQTMPVGDLPGWKQIFTDDFNTPVSLGSFPSAAWSSSDSRRNTYPGNKWSAYPYPWRDTKGQNNSDATLGGWYNPEKTISINGGMMDLWMHTEYLDGAKKRLVSAPMPRIKGPGTGDFEGQLYGRYAVRFRVDPTRLVNNFTGYKTAWLLWPKSNVWPRDGEIDFPEGDLDDTIYGFMHWQGGTSGSDQYYASSGKRFTDWHTAVIEWGPGRNAFYLDGALMTNASGGKSEWFDKVPNTLMRYVLQSETELGGTVPAENTEGHIQIDWISVWSKI